MSSNFDFKLNALLLESTPGTEPVFSKANLKIKITKVLKEEIENHKTKQGFLLKPGNEIKISLHVENLKDYPVNNEYSFSLNYSDYDSDDGEITVNETWKIEKIK